MLSFIEPPGMKAFNTENVQCGKQSGLCPGHFIISICAHVQINILRTMTWQCSAHPMSVYPAPFITMHHLFSGLKIYFITG